MMEIGDIGIKESEDIIRCLEAGDGYDELEEALQVYGDRISGLILCALILSFKDNVRLRKQLAESLSVPEVKRKYYDSIDLYVDSV